MAEHTFTVALVHEGRQYTAQVDFDPERAVKALLERALRSKRRKARSMFGACTATIFAVVPLK